MAAKKKSGAEKDKMIKAARKKSINKLPKSDKRSPQNAAARRRKATEKRLADIASGKG